MSCVLVIDIQERLFSVMANKDLLLENCTRFLKIARTLELPIYATEQNPAKLGPTLAPIKEYFTQEAWNKESFSAYPVFSATHKSPLILLGIEAHVCVYQSAKDFLKHGFEVTLLADCTSSRDLQNKTLALEELRHLGVRILSTEIVAFECMQTYTHPQFKTISQIIK
ncbi:isochorismatase family protein [Helicobacter mehlei]|uniref:Isochorismatase family protein n=1 Tax=Helicobacter mehlei TaxID=2316080 RepID=A0A553UNH3_9HELI|nr:isochorismatase family protein [Helicobacter mehlei]TSA81763.1 isochorismatase family protein [Helicobacter mehlei]